VADEATSKLIDLASRKPIEATAWITRLKSVEGVPIPTLSNALIIFANDPELVGMMSYNEFSSRSVLTRPPPTTEGASTGGPFPRAWEEADRAFCLAYLQRVYNARIKMETVTSAMAGAAVMKRFHPVRDYLKGLVWDGVPRIGVWLTDAFGAAQDPYHHAVGSKFLQAAVRRILHPGCKFDSMLILEGAQDLGKSRACRALFGDEWFIDTLPADISGRDMSDSLQGVWGIEFAEIEHLIRSEAEAIKAFLSRQIERYHPRYGRMPIERPRQCVFIGTTNNDDYARDSTGNRRLWPVRCDFAAADWIAEQRDQLWAEAVATEPSAVLWLDDHVAKDEAIAQQAARQDDDPWQEGIHAFVRGKSSTTIPEIMTEHLSIEKSKQDKRFQMRIANILKRDGWARELVRADGRPIRRWIREVVKS